MNIEIILIILCLIVILNIFVTVSLLKRDNLKPFQKYSQIFLVWLVPFIGALCIWLVNKNLDAKPKNIKEFGGGPNDSIGAGYGDF